MSFVTRIALLCFPASYRPERHYMRGPGPMWHAKHHPSVYAAAAFVPARTREFARNHTSDRQSS